MRHFSPSPTTIGAKPILWIDFDDVYSMELNGSGINTVFNKIDSDRSAASNRFVQATMAQQPIRTQIGSRHWAVFTRTAQTHLLTEVNKVSLNPLFFDLFAVTYRASEFADSGSFIYCSRKDTTGEGYGYLMGYSPTPPLNFHQAITDDGPLNTELNEGPVTNNVPNIVSMRLHAFPLPERLELFVNGTSIAYADAHYGINDVDPTGIGIESRPGWPTPGYLDGGIGEILLFDPLSDFQRNAINRYLSNKWEIALTT